MGREKSKSQRLVIATETKLKCIEHELEHEIATKILFTMLDNYVDKGVTYINKELKLALYCDRPRKYVINLYNDVSKKDTVLIRVDDAPHTTRATRTIHNEQVEIDDDCPTLVQKNL